MEKHKRKVAIIGAGVSGMVAALELKNSCIVHLYEATNKLGGRASSLKENFTGEYIDNGQHICVGAYKSFLSFLSNIDASDSFHILNKYNIPYYYDNEFYRLESKLFKGKLGLLEAILRDTNFSFGEKISTIKFALKLKSSSFNPKRFSNCYEMLRTHKVSEKVISVLWEPLIVSTMNTSVSSASPEIFTNIMRDAFLSKSDNATFLIPRIHFGLFFNNFENKFVDNKNKLFLGVAVKNVQKVGDKYIVEGKEYDDIIVTTPSFITKRLLNELPIEIAVPEYSPIYSIYFWTDRKLNDDIMVLGVGCCFDWIFNRDLTLDRKFEHYSYQLTVSDARHFAQKKDEDIMSEVEADLKKMYPKNFKILHFKIVREQMATFLANSENNAKRPVIASKLDGLYLAGDFSQNGYPGTLEGAAKNGLTAAQHILQHNAV